MPGVFASRYGPWAVVVGGGQGIGAEFGRQLAARGVHLVLVALEDEVREQAARLTREHGVQTRVVVGDIASVFGELVAATEDLEVGLLVLNAALSVRGPWLATPLERHLHMIDVNVRAPLRLIDHFVPPMAFRGRGGVILLGSMAGLHGTPLLATYAATKAFTINLAESLWDEWRPSGVDITAVVPGATDTPGYRTSAPRTRVAPMPVGPVVAAALRALGRRPWVVPGRTNTFAGLVLSRILPRRLAVRVMGRTMRAMYGQDQG